MVTAPPYDPQHFVRVDQTVTLTLKNLDPHTGVTVSFDLYIMKSWDGNNPNYGPDRWSLSLGGGNTLLDTTFSNNFKTGADLSLQNYPSPDSLPQTGAASANTLGSNFYGDSIYHLVSTFPHSSDTLILNFSSSLFEGKGTDDESWGRHCVYFGDGAGPLYSQWRRQRCCRGDCDSRWRRRRSDRSSGVCMSEWTRDLLECSLGHASWDRLCEPLRHRNPWAPVT